MFMLIMLTGLNKLVISLIALSLLCILISVAMVVMNYAFHFTSYIYTNSLTLFECGVDVQKYKQTSFSLQFFMIGLIFILFDLEIMFLVCIMMTNSLYSYLYWLLLFMVFIYVTLLYEWMFNKIIWFK